MALINANRILLNKTMKNKNEAIKEMAKLSTDELSTAYKIKPEQAEKEKQRWAVILSGCRQL